MTNRILLSLSYALALGGSACGHDSGSHGTDAASSTDAAQTTDAARTTDAGTDAATSPDGGSVWYPPGIDSAVADALKTLVYGVAAATQSRPLSCEFIATTLKGSPIDAKNLTYTLAVTPNDLGPPEGDDRRDYTVMYKQQGTIPNPDDASSPIDGSRTMIVSYIEFVGPTLMKSGSTYSYDFGGYYTDNLVVKTNTAGTTVTEIDFLKSDDSGVIMSILCKTGS